MFSLAVAAIIGGLLNRLRGGWLNDLMGWGQKTHLSRLAWAIPTAALMTEMSHSPLWMVPVLVVTNWAALALFGTGQYIPDVPLRLVPDWLGLARNALASVFLVLFSPLMFAAYTLSGAFHAFLYWAGHRVGKHYFYGEAIVGAVSWSIIVATKC